MQESPPKNYPYAETKPVSGLLKFAPLLLLMLSLTYLPGCTAAREVRPTKPEQALLWPHPPEPAKITYLRTIRNASDIDAGKGFFSRLADLVLGAKAKHIIKPYGVTADSMGRVIVADTAFKRIHIFDVRAQKYTSIKHAGRRMLQTPIAAAVDSADNIYVTDSSAASVYAFNKKGKFLFSFKTGGRPTGIAIDKLAGKIYTVDTDSHNIGVYDLKGNKLSTIGRWGSGPGEFNRPVDIFVDTNGELYVVDTMNYRIQVFDKGGRYVTEIGSHGDGTGDFGRPKGVAVDRDGNIYVVDALFDTVQIFDRSGGFLLNFGEIGSSAGKFWLPCGLYIDASGYIYVADSYNRRVQVFEYLGQG